MSILQENIMKRIEEKEIVQEGFLRKEKASFWYEELNTLVNGVSKIKVLAKNYVNAVKKVKPGEEKNIIFSIDIEMDATIKNIFNKKKRGKSFMKVTLLDANGILHNTDRPIGVIKLETKFSDGLIPL